jgi:hypothetical protein
MDAHIKIPWRLQNRTCSRIQSTSSPTYFIIILISYSET